MSVLLDTHFWVWWLTPGSPLTVRERDALDGLAERSSLAVSAISLWEVQVLHSKGRLRLPLQFAEWLTRAADPGMLTVLTLDAEVVIALDALPESFRGDPADRLIVATARAHALPIATRDRRIRSSRAARLWKA